MALSSCDDDGSHANQVRKWINELGAKNSRKSNSQLADENVQFNQHFAPRSNGRYSVGVDSLTSEMDVWFPKGGDFRTYLTDYFESSDGSRVHLDGVYTGTLPNGENSINTFCMKLVFAGDKAIQIDLYGDYGGFLSLLAKSSQQGDGCTESA